MGFVYVHPRPRPVVDLNAVRLETLLGAARHVSLRLSLRAYAPAEWLDAEQCAAWSFAFRNGRGVLERVLRRAVDASAKLPPDRGYRRVRQSLGAVLYWCRVRSEEKRRRSPVAAMAFQAIVDELAPVVSAADRAPAWLRVRARSIACA